MSESAPTETSTSPAKTGGSEPSDATGPEDPYASRHHAEPSRWHVVPSLAVVALIAVGDASNFKTAFSLKYPDLSDGDIAVMVAVATLAALAAMMFAGHEARKITAGDPSARRRWAAVCLTGWLGMGITAFLVRMLTPPMTGADSGGLTLVGAEGEQTPAWLDALPAALLFLFIYAVCGAVAFLIAYKSHNQLRHKLIVARSRVRRAQRNARRTQARRVRAEETHAMLLADQEAWDARKAAVLRRLSALAEEGRAHARLVIAGYLGNPADTSGLIRDLQVGRADTDDDLVTDRKSA